MNNNRKNESGNVLWFILIALVLIAALTAVLSRSGSSVDQTGNFEQLSIQVSKLLRYTRGIEQAIENMRFQGVSESDLSFIDSGNTGYNHAVAQPNENRVFHVEGGARVYEEPNEAWLDRSQSANALYQEWLFTGQLGITNNSSRPSPNDTSLVMILPYVSQNMCIAINRYLNYNGEFDSATPIEDDTSILADIVTLSKFNGEGTDYARTSDIDGEDTVYPAPVPSDLAFWRNRTVGCTQGTDDRYAFFFTLIRR